MLIIDLPGEPAPRKLGESLTVLREDEAPMNASDVSGIIKGVNEGFERRLRRLRILVHPDSAPVSKDGRELLKSSLRQALRERFH
jgi:hypothetical protein